VCAPSIVDRDRRAVGAARKARDTRTGQQRNQRRRAVLINVNLQPIVALIAGILILIMPRLLNYIVAIYLIVIGILGLAR
jgi:hypothetical protein